LLLYCSKTNEIDEVGELLKIPGIDVNWNNHLFDFAPLDAAAEDGNLEVVKLLLAHPNIKPGTLSRSGKTAFFRAVETNRVEVIRYMLQDPRTPVDYPWLENGVTAFMLAVFMKHNEIAKLVLADQRCNPGVLDYCRYTALHHAVFSQNTEMIALMLADPRVGVNEGTVMLATPFYAACQEGNTEVLRLFLDCPRVDVNQVAEGSASPFYVAAAQGKTDAVKLLLKDTRIKHTQKTEDNVTPLWMAAQGGHLEVVEVLLASDVDFEPSAKCAAGEKRWSEKTAAEIARLVDQEAVANLLERFQLNPAEVRAELREKIPKAEAAAAAAAAEVAKKKASKKQ